MDRRLLAWSLYDFSNTAFSAMYVTVFFPIFVTIILGGNELHVGATFSLSMLAVGLIVPILGVIIDQTGRKTPYLLGLTLVCCAATVLTGYFDLWGALIAGFLANTCYHACLVIYNAYLPEIAKLDRQGSASGTGVSIGYFGTLGSIVAVALIARPFGLETLTGTRVSFALTAAFFFLFSIPLFVAFWHERGRRLSVSIRGTLREVWTTFIGLPRDAEMRNFLIGGFLYSNAITAAIMFLGLYARKAMKLPLDNFVFGILPLLAISAALGAYAAGPLTDRYGGRKVLLGAGLLWIVALLGLIFKPEAYVVFTVMSCIGGASMGAVWTARRPLLVRLAPGKKIGEYFGFQELTDKFSGVIGPVTFGYLAKNYGYASGLWAMIGFFVLGLMAFFLMRTRKHANNYKSTRRA